jgi:nucleotide-binding universal stress UspA family protein/CBS domain-containing protein
MLPIRSILIPTDFSERSGHALQLAGALARDYDARLTVLHVAAPPTMFYGEGVILPPEPEALYQEARSRLNGLALPDLAIRADRRLEQGDPATEILHIAQQIHCDLIVMGTHGRTGLKRLLMGSVAEQVVRKASCPVLTLAAPFALAMGRPTGYFDEKEQAMRVKAVMTEGAECVRPEATLQQAAERMKDLDVGSLPVCENDRLVGMVTDRDITVRATAEACDPCGTRVREVMTPDISYIFEDQLVTEAAQQMEEKQIRRLPVLNRNKRLVGIVSIGDLAVKSGDEELAGVALEQVSEPAMPRR